MKNKSISKPVILRALAKNAANVISPNKASAKKVKNYFI